VKKKIEIVIVGVLFTATLALLGYKLLRVWNLARWQQALIEQPSTATPEQLARRAEIVAELQPVTLSNCELTRMGGPNDGGYLMCKNLLPGIQTAYSYGIGWEDNWGCDVSAAHKVPVHQYDCFSPVALQCAGGVFQLNAECVGPKTETIDGRKFDTIANQMARNGDTGKKMVVKIDVEGAEWQSILATPDEVLAGIDQMPMELHGVDDPGVLEALRKLKTHFYLLSVHFNNWSCDGRLAPMKAWAYQVLFVNKRLGVVGPQPAGSATVESLLAPDAPKQPDCQFSAKR